MKTYVIVECEELNENKRVKLINYEQLAELS